ncbi:MAG: polyA polymerase family protein, poly(A) polymerase [Microgenomates group bacterium GW2011_GWC1_49_7]|nr:MAG: polyA polymerase family protein, poly(A) polymerase [Microgenomates group bacterium GW2011_GWC1_49_7]
MISLPQTAKQIIRSLQKAGYEAYAVGGSVRDVLMGNPTRGWDFTTNATPEEILKVFPDSFYDNQFGTVGIKMPDDIYEVTTYRSEKGYKDHRHPDTVRWGKTLEEDLSRRDFTINAIATDGKTIIDPYKGQEDIQSKLIRAVGTAGDRFAEDALRLMRAVRIAAELGFMIEPETLAAIKKNSASLTQISPERIHDELLRILAAPFAGDGILLLKNSGLLTEIIPELDAAFAIQQKSPERHHIYDVGTHSVMALKHCPSPDPVVRLATLLHDIGKVKTFEIKNNIITFYNHEVVSTKIAKNILARLKFSKRDTEKILTLIRWHQFTVDERQTDSALRRFIRHVGKENLPDMLALRIGDRLGGGARETSWRLELFKKRLEEVQKQPFTVADLKINGFDVMKELNVKPGPIIGKILNQLFSEVEAGTLKNEREVLLNRLRAKN